MQPFTLGVHLSAGHPTMLDFQRIPTTQFRTWGSDSLESDSVLLSPVNLEPEQSVRGNDLWICVDSTTALTSENAHTPFASTGKLECGSPTNKTPVTESQTLDTVTFPQHAVHLLPWERNGAWHTQARRAFKNPKECASAIREALGQYVHEFDLPKLVRKLEQVAQDREQDVTTWLNQTLADYDLVEMHGQMQRLVPAISMPNMRQIDHAIDATVGVAESVRKRCLELQPLQAHPGDRYFFAQVVGRRAERALVEQGICKDWQLVGDKHQRMLHAIQSFLMHTFKHTQQTYTYVPLYRAKPQWIADREKKVWCLELDVGRVGIKVGPATDRSLIELGSIQTGFELPEYFGCLSVKKFDHQVQGVENEWQLLESQR